MGVSDVAFAGLHQQDYEKFSTQLQVPLLSQGRNTECLQTDLLSRGSKLIL